MSGKQFSVIFSNTAFGSLIFFPFLILLKKKINYEYVPNGTKMFSQ